jgi:hypothetical protein
MNVMTSDARICSKHGTEKYPNENGQTWCRKCDRESNDKTRYNFTRRGAVHSEQQQRCPICLKEFDRYSLVVDHDHNCCDGDKSCGKCIRGLLCRVCNQGLPKSATPESLRRAADYIQKYLDKRAGYVFCSQCNAKLRPESVAKHEIRHMKARRNKYPIGTHNSVYTVGGGLPDSNRRRH